MNYKIWLVGLMAIMFGFEARAASYEYSLQQCKRVMRANPPTVEISYNYGDLKFDMSKNSQELSNIYAMVNGGSGDKNIHGLTALSPHLSMATGVKMEKLNSGRYCFYPQSIQVKLWYEPTVYIINSLEPGSCRFKITARHEQTHLDFGHKALSLFAHAIRGEIEKIISDVGPRVEADNITGEQALNVVAQNLNQDYQRQMEVLFSAFKKTLEEQNAIIDTPENYLAESLLCR